MLERKSRYTHIRIDNGKKINTQGKSICYLIQAKAGMTFPNSFQKLEKYFF